MMHKTQRDTVNVDENGLLDGGGSGIDAPPHLPLVGPGRAAHGLTEVALGDGCESASEVDPQMGQRSLPIHTFGFKMVPKAGFEPAQVFPPHRYVTAQPNT
jgi:hypothetical protein